jgi:hypothetical protein
VRQAALALSLLHASACSTHNAISAPVELPPGASFTAPTPDPFWPERVRFSNFSQSPELDFPAQPLGHGRYAVHLNTGRTIQVGPRLNSVDLWAPDIGAVSFVSLGYHMDSETSTTTLVSLQTGRHVVLSGFVESTPQQNLLIAHVGGPDSMDNDPDQGAFAMIRVSEGRFQPAGTAWVDFEFQLNWVSPHCVTIAPTQRVEGRESMSFSENQDGTWSRKDGAC